MNDKIQRIIENQKIRNRLYEIGIHSGEISKSSNRKFFNKYDRTKCQKVFMVLET